MALYTYQLSNMIYDTVKKGLDLSGEDGTVDYAFDLNEFFATTENITDGAIVTSSGEISFDIPPLGEMTLHSRKLYKPTCSKARAFLQEALPHMAAG